LAQGAEGFLDGEKHWVDDEVHRISCLPSSAWAGKWKIYAILDGFFGIAGRFLEKSPEKSPRIERMGNRGA
jgi:hypothetical protein